MTGRVLQRKVVTRNERESSTEEGAVITNEAEISIGGRGCYKKYEREISTGGFKKKKKRML